MSFRFSVKKTWGNQALNVFHLIGILEDGKIISNSSASISEIPGIDILVKAVVISPSVSGNRNELTLSVERPSLHFEDLEGCTLIGK